MRVTLTQDELFEAISAHLIDKLNLDNTASIEISFTAGRSPKGYTAEVDITYPKSATASKITAKPYNEADDTDVATPGIQAAPVPEAVTSPAAAAADSAVKLFD